MEHREACARRWGSRWRLAVTRKLFFCVLALACLAVPAPVLLAADTADAVIRVGGSTWYPPFHFPRADGTPDGFDVVVASRIAEGLDQRTEVRFDNWTSVLDALDRGELDLVPMFVSEPRRQRFLFSDPYNVEYHQLFGLVRQSAQRGLEGLDGFVVAMEQSAYAAEELERASPGAVLHMADSEAEALRMVARGEADYALIPSQVAYYTLENEALGGVVSLSPPLLPVPYAFALQRGDTELLEQVNEQLLALQRDGTLRQLREEWLHRVPVPEAEDGSLWWLATLLLCMVLGSGTWWAHHAHLRRRFDEQSRALEMAQDQLRALRLTDHVSGLMTRQYFLHLLEERLRSRSEEEELVVGMILLRDVGAIEQDLGPGIVDQLIFRLARQLEHACIGEIGYFGSSRFVVMLDNPACAQDCMNRLLDAISGDQVIDGAAIEVHPLAGTSSWPRDGRDSTELLRNAMTAQNQAWSENRRLVEYDVSLDPDPVNYRLVAELRQALDNDSLYWVLQPQYDIRSSSIVGAEMLVRWDHPTQGMVPPDLFVPLAESAGLIQRLTRQALLRAVAILTDWQREGRRLQLSVNVSPLDIADRHFVNEIVQLAGEQAGQLTLEITEAAVAQSGSLLSEGVARLKQAGFRISLDDYGTGYASLTHLKELHFDELKLDRSFVAGISSNERLLRLTRASILLGLELGCQIVAEGVEDARTAGLLRDQGCYLLQGYLVSRPLSLATFNKFIDMPLAFEGHPYNRWSEPALEASG